MNYWIFQCKKERYDISDPSILSAGMKGWWEANQYRCEMDSGDIVFFWLAGDRSYRGIYCWGTLTSKPYFHEEGEKKGYRVNIVCKKRLKRYISIDDIGANKTLLNMQIISMAIGSNFLLKESEGKELFSMLGKPGKPSGGK